MMDFNRLTVWIRKPSLAYSHSNMFITSCSCSSFTPKTMFPVLNTWGGSPVWRTCRRRSCYIDQQQHFQTSDSVRWSRADQVWCGQHEAQQEPDRINQPFSVQDGGQRSSGWQLPSTFRTIQLLTSDSLTSSPVQILIKAAETQETSSTECSTTGRWRRSSGSVELQ